MLDHKICLENYTCNWFIKHPDYKNCDSEVKQHREYGGIDGWCLHMWQREEQMEKDWRLKIEGVGTQSVKKIQNSLEQEAAANWKYYGKNNKFGCGRI